MLDIVTIYNRFVSSELQQAFLPLKIALLLLSLVLFIAIIYFFKNTSYLDNLWLDDWRDYLIWKRKYSLRAKKKQYKEKQATQFKPAEEVIAKPEKTITKVVPRTDWERILDKLESGRPLNYNLALLDADKLLQKKLRDRELGEFYAQKVKEARELVEEVMADDSRDLTLEEVGQAIDVYKKALDSLD